MLLIVSALLAASGDARALELGKASPGVQLGMQVGAGNWIGTDAGYAPRAMLEHEVYGLIGARFSQILAGLYVGFGTSIQLGSPPADDVMMRLDSSTQVYGFGTAFAYDRWYFMSALALLGNSQLLNASQQHGLVNPAYGYQVTYDGPVSFRAEAGYRFFSVLSAFLSWNFTSFSNEHLVYQSNPMITVDRSLGFGAVRWQTLSAGLSVAY